MQTETINNNAWISIFSNAYVLHHHTLRVWRLGLVYT